MKNINKHRTPQNKLDAFDDWCRGPEGCSNCNRKCDNYNPLIREIRKNRCFNAWLHSTTIDAKYHNN
jgi:hypothetical protein